MEIINTDMAIMEKAAQKKSDERNKLEIRRREPYE